MSHECLHTVVRYIYCVNLALGTDLTGDEKIGVKYCEHRFIIKCQFTLPCLVRDSAALSKFTHCAQEVPSTHTQCVCVCFQLKKEQFAENEKQRNEGRFFSSSRHLQQIHFLEEENTNYSVLKRNTVYK